MHKRLFGILGSVAIVVAACGGATTSKAPSAAATTAASAPPPASTAPAASPSGPAAIDLVTTNYKPEAVGNSGGKLVYATSGQPNSIWLTTYDTAAADVVGFGPSLWSLWNNTADFKYYGQLAKNVPTVENGGVTVTGDKMDVKIELIPGAKWSDGQPITCEDVSYMVTWYMDKAQVGLAQGTTGYEDVASVDGGTGTSCVVHFNKIYEQYLGLWTPLLPAHYLKTASVKEAQDKLYTHGKAEDVAKGVWSGPYMPTSWVAGSQIDYVPNPQFWDTIKKAKAPFDSVTEKFYSNEAAVIAGFQNDESDVAIEFNHTHLAAIKAANIPDTAVDTVDGLTYEHNSWNTASLTKKFGAPGAKALLEALHYAYDKDEINKRVLSGSATPTCNYNSPLTWSYHEVPCYKHDVAKANDILDKAGFTKGADGIRTINGNPVELVACTRADRQYRQDTLRLLGTQLQQIGVKLNLDHVATSSAILFSGWEGPDAAPADAPCNLTRGNFDVTEFAWVSTPDPTSIYNLWLSTKDPSQGDHSGQNYIRVNNPELDAIMTGMLRTVDLKKIQKDMVRVQELYADPANAFPEIPLYNWRTVLLKSPKMHNISNNSTAATQVWNIEDWWRAK